MDHPSRPRPGRPCGPRSADGTRASACRHEADPGDATEPQQPGSTGAGGSLPAPRDAPGGGPAGRRAAGTRDRTGHSDAELLKLHVEGDSDAFGQLFLRHRDRLWAVAIRTLADPEDAADALQDAMISAFRRAASFRGESAVTTWLHRIVVNACLDRIRRRSARPEVTGGDERLLDVIAAGEAGSDPAAGSETSIEVMAALRQLPHDQQVALVLVDMLGYPVADAAEVLDVAQGTVKSRCARGRARLLPKLAHLRQSGEGEGRASGSGFGAQPGPRAGAGPGPGAGAGPGPGAGAGPGPGARSVPGQPAQPGRLGQLGQPEQADLGPPGQPGNPSFRESSVDSEPRTRNRLPPGSVLPAQKGGDEQE